MILADIEFDHDRPDDVIKHRKLGGNVTYEQDGVLFSSGFRAIKILERKAKRDPYDDMSREDLIEHLRHANVAAPRKQKKKAAASKTPVSPRQSANDKLAGYKDDDQPDYVRQALSENHQAVMAEENAQ